MTERLRILIVDDSPEDREVYHRFLSRSSNDYDLAQAETGEEGLDYCRQQTPDCILLDYNLPDLNGLEFLAALKELPEADSASVVMMTGQGNETVAVEAMKKGAQDYLVKGDTTAVALQHTIANAVEKTSLLRALEAQRRELERSNAELEQFAYLASHDLQAPLRRIQAFCGLLQKRYGDKFNSDAEEYFAHIVRSAQHMSALINGLLGFSKVGTDEKPLEMTDLNDVVKQAITNLQVAIDESRTAITCDPLPSLPANRLQMIQLFQNLIGNGIKYCRDRAPAIHVAVEEQRDFVQFSVQDNGIGIDPKQFDVVFQIFKRLHGDSEFSGTGIGLATCKKIVERHGGSIWVESNPGGGSRFCFSLPLPAEGLPGATGPTPSGE